MKQLKISKFFIYISILIILAGFLSSCGTPMRYSRNITMYEPMKELSVVKDLELAISKGQTKKLESFIIAFVKPSYEITPFKAPVSTDRIPNYMKKGYGKPYKKSDIVVTAIDMGMASSIEEKDNTDKVLADALSEFYTSLGKKLWDHIDPEEWEK